MLDYFHKVFLQNFLISVMTAGRKIPPLIALALPGRSDIRPHYTCQTLFPTQQIWAELLPALLIVALFV
jgi:hypothetical protein